MSSASNGGEPSGLLKSSGLLPVYHLVSSNDKNFLDLSDQYIDESSGDKHTLLPSLGSRLENIEHASKSSNSLQRQQQKQHYYDVHHVNTQKYDKINPGRKPLVTLHRLDVEGSQLKETSTLSNVTRENIPPIPDLQRGSAVSSNLPISTRVSSQEVVNCSDAVSKLHTLPSSRIYPSSSPTQIQSSTDDEKTTISDVADLKSALNASRKIGKLHPRSNTTIIPNNISSSGVLTGLSTSSERYSLNASGAGQAADGLCRARLVSYSIKQGDNSSGNERLLVPPLGRLDTGNRNSSDSRQGNNSRHQTRFRKPAMGDLLVLDKNGTQPGKVSEADDNNSDIHMNGKSNGHKSTKKKSDKNVVTCNNKVGDDSFCDDEIDNGSGPCGWGKLQFRLCQKLRDAKWFLVVLTMCGACQGMAVNGFVNTVISTVERRYEISSTESGLIASCYDIMFVVLVIPISYFGGHGHKPRYLGIGIFTLGIGSFVFSLPQFISGNYYVENADETVCKLETNISTPCNTDSSRSLSNYKYFFYLGQLLHGAGATPLYTLGVTFMDENVPQRSSAFYNGIFYTGAIIGPAIGYMVGAKFLDIYTDVWVDPKSLGLDPNNPKWVGAWWIGFLISGTFGVLLSLPLLAFPSALPGSRKYALERGKETQASENVDQTGQDRGFKDILLSLRYLLTNIPFMFINLAAAADGILVAGFSTFMPKYIEYEFGLPAGTAALYVGLAVVPAGGGATFAGGFLIKCFNLKVRGILRLCTVVSFALCLMTVALLMECDTTPFAGVTLSYGQTDVGAAAFLGKNLDNTCNRNCSCSEEDFFPVCGRDMVMYFSPCYAGCTDVSSDGSVKRYANCSCVNYNLTSTDYAEGNTHMAQFGKCDSSCKWLTLFLLLFGVMIVLVFITSMPSLTATLRCVPDHQRSFGLGIQWIVARCLGSIPGPILFGKMFDFACLVWQKRCIGDGSCFFYDTHKLSLYLLGLAIAFAVAAALSFLLAYCFYKVKEVDDEVVLQVSDPSWQSSQNTLAQTNKDMPDLLEKQEPEDNSATRDREFTGTNL